MDDYLRAFDLATGAELWKGRLPAGGQATPMSYRLDADGPQYVVIAAGGHAARRHPARRPPDRLHARGPHGSGAGCRRALDRAPARLHARPASRTQTPPKRRERTRAAPPRDPLCTPAPMQAPSRFTKRPRGAAFRPASTGFQPVPHRFFTIPGSTPQGTRCGFAVTHCCGHGGNLSMRYRSCFLTGSLEFANPSPC